jgi:hypothetical protein
MNAKHISDTLREAAFMNYPAVKALHWRPLRRSHGEFADTGGHGRFTLCRYGSTSRPMWRLALDGRTVGVFQHREHALAAAETRHMASGR